MFALKKKRLKYKIVLNVSLHNENWYFKSNDKLKHSPEYFYQWKEFGYFEK